MSYPNFFWAFDAISGEEPGAQEKWMKATCTEAVYLCLGWCHIVMDELITSVQTKVGFTFGANTRNSTNNSVRLP